MQSDYTGLMVSNLSSLSLDAPEFQALLDALPVPIWVKDAHSRLLTVNQAAQAVAPLPLEKMRGTTGGDFFDPEQLVRTMEQDQEAFAIGAPTVREEEFWDPQRKQKRW